jgi:drug/metabolite transporter (DMT)-like permease
VPRRLPALQLTWLACLVGAVARMDAGRLGVSTYLVPPLTIALSAALLGEAPPVLAVLGGLVCLVGVALSRRR